LALDGVWKLDSKKALTMKMKQSQSYPESTLQLGYFEKFGQGLKIGIATSTRATIKVYCETWLGSIKMKYDVMQKKYGFEWKFGSGSK
jgi:hypothetical protein